jgi:general secretion pathway protein K
MSSSPQPRRKSHKAGGERGFVLLVVLSVLGLLALVVATFAHVARTHVRAAAASVESGRAEALADAGVNMAILDAIAARETDKANRRFLLDATPATCGLEGEAGTLTIVVQDEAGKVDLNIGSESILRALVFGAGVKGGEAAVDAILDFRDSDDDRRASGAERADYRAAGRSHGPKNAAFLVVEELASVLGLTQADVDRLRPFATVYSGQTGVDPNVASSALIDVLARGVQDGGALAFKSTPDGDGGAKFTLGGGAPLPEELIAASVRKAFSVRSQVRTPGGVVFVREAVVELTASRSMPYVVRRWSRGAFPIGGKDVPGAALAPC